MAYQAFLTITLVLACLLVCDVAANRNKTTLYPDIADVSHASPEAVEVFRNYFVAKSSDSGQGWADSFNQDEASYYDSTLGLTIAADRSQLVSVLDNLAEGFQKNAPDGRSYPLRILGDTIGGAIVYFVDTPTLFGAEIRTMSSFDFLDGTISRQIDNWNGRGNAVKASLKGDAVYPYPFGAPEIHELAASEMQVAAHQLNAALSSNNASAVSDLLTYNAVWEDLTLSTRVEGQLSIASYLQRALNQLPYGPGTQVAHVLGSAIGGGYEWRPSGDTVRYGITALELDWSGMITRFTAVWDGSRVDDTVIRNLAQLAPTP